MQSNQIVICIIILILIWALIESKLLMTSKYTVKSAKLPKNSKPINFVVLADLHNGTFGRNNVRLIKRIERLSPDYILVAGDMINKKEPAYNSNAYSLLESLAKKYKIYYAYGNHEQRMEQYHEAQEPAVDTVLSTRVAEKPRKSVSQQSLDKNKMLYSTWVECKERLSRSGVYFLDNDTISIKKDATKFSLSGVSIGPEYFERHSAAEMKQSYLTELLGTAQKEAFQILIAHNPLYFKDYVKWGADLVICGHFHGGMVRLPGIGGLISPQAKFFPKYDSGIFSEKSSQMVVSRGLGSHSIMPRLFNMPELVFIQLKNE